MRIFINFLLIISLGIIDFCGEEYPSDTCVIVTNKTLNTIYFTATAHIPTINYTNKMKADDNYNPKTQLYLLGKGLINSKSSSSANVYIQRFYHSWEEFFNDVADTLYVCLFKNEKDGLEWLVSRDNSLTMDLFTYTLSDLKTEDPELDINYGKYVNR